MRQIWGSGEVCIRVAQVHRRGRDGTVRFRITLGDPVKRQVLARAMNLNIGETATVRIHQARMAVKNQPLANLLQVRNERRKHDLVTKALFAPHDQRFAVFTLPFRQINILPIRPRPVPAAIRWRALVAVFPAAVRIDRRRVRQPVHRDNQERIDGSNQCLVLPLHAHALGELGVEGHGIEVTHRLDLDP